MSINNPKEEKDYIDFYDFVKALNILCRSEDEVLDKYIFKLFDMRGKNKIHRDEMIMMTINMPDMNFGFNKNIKNYYTRKIEDSAV